MRPLVASAKTALSLATENVERTLIVTSYMYFCLVILVEVVLRYVFSYSTPWGEMSARYAFILLVYVSMSEVARGRNHIRINLVPLRLSPKRRLFLYLYFDVIQVFVAGLVVFYAVGIMRDQIKNETLMTGADINMAFAQAILPVGWGLLAIRVVQRIFTMIVRYRATGEVPAGEGDVSE